MEPWYKVATPRREVREGRSFNPDEFAIALEQVVAGTAPEDYRDPAQFFARTCFTRALREHAGMVLRRLSGRTDNTSPVLTLITQFGGVRAASRTCPPPRREAYRHFQSDPRHPSLHFKKVMQPSRSMQHVSGSGTAPLPSWMETLPSGSGLALTRTATSFYERCERSHRTTACSQRPSAAADTADVRSIASACQREVLTWTRRTRPTSSG